MLSCIYELAVTTIVIKRTCQREFLTLIVKWEIILEYGLNTYQVTFSTF